MFRTVCMRRTLKPLFAARPICIIKSGDGSAITGGSSSSVSGDSPSPSMGGNITGTSKMLGAPPPSRSSRVFSFTKESDSTTDSHVDAHVDGILAGNRRWVAESVAKDPNFLKKLSAPQKPKFLYIGCADSRVPANEIFGLGAGEVFVHRNVGNLVPGNDLNALSVIEYAVTHLGVTDIIVTGHYDCGAVRAAASRQDLGLLENWLRLIRDVYRLHKDYLDLIADSEARHITLVELNVIEQCLNVFKTGVVQRARHASRTKLREDIALTGLKSRVDEDAVFPRVHGIVFNPSEGILKKLPVNFDKRLGDMDHIYGLYETRRPKATGDKAAEAEMANKAE